MPKFTCPTCGQPMQSGECLRCRTAMSIAKPEHTEQAKVGPPASSDGATREGEAPISPKPGAPWPYKHEPGPMLSGWVTYFVISVAALTGLGLLLPMCAKVRVPEMRTGTINCMKQIVLGCLEHQDFKKHLPTPRMTTIKDGKEHEIRLSWRVAILPFIEQEELHKSFDLTLAWNHPSNIPREDQMPNVYQCVYLGDNEPADKTRFQCFTGPNTLFPNNAPVKLVEIKDGASLTFLFAQADLPVIWTRPADMAIRAGQALPLPKDRFLAAMADGAVRMVHRETTSDQTLRMVIDPRDGQVLPADWDN